MILETNSPQETFSAGRQLKSISGAGDYFDRRSRSRKNCFYTGTCQRTWHRRTGKQSDLYDRAVYDEGRLPLYHFDVYRIGDIEEMDEIGYEDYFYGEGLTMIEWANLIEEILPDHYREITIEKDLEKGFDYRKITILDR